MEKIARLCWNTHDWKRPSGSEGKSLSESSYEKIVGFGHEEWLLDDSKILPDGCHYGFLQPMNVKSQKHVGMTYDIHLFAISPKKQDGGDWYLSRTTTALARADCKGGVCIGLADNYQFIVWQVVPDRMSKRYALSACYVCGIDAAMVELVKECLVVVGSHR